MEGYQGVIFDLDGTLLDTLGDLADSMNHILGKYGLPERSYEELADFLGRGSAYYLEQASGGVWKGELFDERLEEYKEWYGSHMDRKTAPFAGCLEMLEELGKEGIRRAVVSNKFDRAVKELCRRHFGERMECVLGEGNGLRPKPSADMILAAAKEIGLAPEECVFVGDTEVDLAAAQAAGMDCIGAAWGFRGRKRLEAAGMKRIAESWEELEQMILEGKK